MSVLAVAYNNPGCIRDFKTRFYIDPTTNKVHLIVPKRGRKRYSKYDTPEEGMTALALLLKRYERRGRDTVGKIIRIYAPSFENNTGKYISSVCRELGVSSRTKLDMNNPEVMKALMKSITRMEGGQQSMNYFSNGVFDKAVAHVCLAEDRPNKNPFYLPRPSFFTRLFSRQAREDYEKWKNLYNTDICTFPGGGRLTLLDLGIAVEEGRITLEQAAIIRHASEKSADKSYANVNQMVAQLLPETQSSKALATAINNKVETGCVAALKQYGQSTDIDNVMGSSLSGFRANSVRS